MQMRVIQWDFDAWEDYLYWQGQDKKILKRINQLLKDICRNPFEGIGKPEPLKGNLTGFWSRRVDGEHRLIYAVEESVVVVISVVDIIMIRGRKTALFSLHKDGSQSMSFRCLTTLDISEDPCDCGICTFCDAESRIFDGGI